MDAEAGQEYGDEVRLIEAQMHAQQYREQGFQEGDTLVVTPRRAKVFVPELVH